MRRIGVRKERYRRGRGAGWEAGCRARRLPFCREQRGGWGGLGGSLRRPSRISQMRTTSKRRVGGCQSDTLALGRFSSDSDKALGTHRVGCGKRGASVK